MTTAPEPGAVGYLDGRAAMRRSLDKSRTFPEREFLTEMSDWLCGDRPFLAVDVRAFIAGGTAVTTELWSEDGQS